VKLSAGLGPFTRSAEGGLKGYSSKLEALEWISTLPNSLPSIK
jgi:hypothetical protein